MEAETATEAQEISLADILREADLLETDVNDEQLATAARAICW